MVILLLLACPAPLDARGRADCSGRVEETCNGLDDDCNGQVDDVPEARRPKWYLDIDADGFGFGPPVAACERPAGTVATVGDCEPSDAGVFPRAQEVCNGVDDDCDKLADDADPGTQQTGPWFSDADGDGFGDATTAFPCTAPGRTRVSGDCNDLDPLTHPETHWTLDRDEDGWPGEERDPPLVGCMRPPGGHPVVGTLDCDDDNPDIFPFASETCNGIDDDCDAFVDDADVSLDLGTTTNFHLDEDGDGFGQDTVGKQTCAPPDDIPYSLVGGDCDDANPAIPGQETCIPGDEDCDGLSGHEDPDVDWSTAFTSYVDGDADGFGDEDAIVLYCGGDKNGLSDIAGDCDDAESVIGLPSTYGPDADGDGTPVEPLTGEACVAPEGHAMSWWGLDCNDADPNISPIASDRLAAGDEDCNGVERILATQGDWAVGDTQTDLARTLAVTPDLDDDGLPEIVAITYYSAYLIEAGSDVVHLWRDPDTTMTEDEIPVWPDIDADGRPDMALPSLASDVWQTNGGAVYLHRMDGDPWNEVDLPYDAAAGGVIPTRSSEYLGKSLLVLDADVDGVDDLLVGAKGAAAEGEVRLFRGPLVDRWTLSEASDGLIDGSGADEVGARLARVGDLDGDGLDEIALGMPGASASVGRIALWNGEPDVWMVSDDLQRNVDGVDASRLGDAPFGRVGDLSGDGLDDLAALSAGTDTAWLLSRVDGPVTTDEAFATIFSAAEPAADSVAGPYDLDEDGQSDLVIQSAGALLAFLGPLAGNVGNLDSQLAFQPYATGSDLHTTVIPGDFNADGLPDLVLAVPYAVTYDTLSILYSPF